jgi:hypothetical protein
VISNAAVPVLLTVTLAEFDEPTAVGGIVSGDEGDILNIGPETGGLIAEYSTIKFTEVNDVLVIVYEPEPVKGPTFKIGPPNVS